MRFFRVGSLHRALPGREGAREPGLRGRAAPAFPSPADQEARPSSNRNPSRYAWVPVLAGPLQRSSPQSSLSRQASASVPCGPSGPVRPFSNRDEQVKFLCPGFSGSFRLWLQTMLHGGLASLRDRLPVRGRQQDGIGERGGTISGTPSHRHRRSGARAAANSPRPSSPWGHPPPERKLP